MGIIIIIIFIIVPMNYFNPTTLGDKAQVEVCLMSSLSTISIRYFN